MSDLQIGLLVIGAAIVAAVLLFNWIRSAASGNRLTRHFRRRWAMR
jgi:hypothetical protein